MTSVLYALNRTTVGAKKAYFTCRQIKDEGLTTEQPGEAGEFDLKQTRSV